MSSSETQDDFFEDEFALMDDEEDGSAPLTISDPFYPINLVIFHFNDKMYFWVLKPVATGYSKIIPRFARKGITNIFANLRFPVRFINCALQGKVQPAATELSRFMVNSTLGILGFFDAANHFYGLTEQDEDLGQTLAKYGIKDGFYIVAPILGPSTLRDTIGRSGDSFMYPVSYVRPWGLFFGIDLYGRLNFISLKLNDYETMKNTTIDPYNGVKSFYLQYRRKQIEE